jgi:hypothetical protein
MSGKQANSGPIVAVQKDRGQKRPRCTTEEFIEKARLVHGDKYDYSKVMYLHSITKVIITCPHHGDFEQIPANHLHGKGCRGCGNRSKTSDSETFEYDARSVHGTKYDYIKVVYKNSYTKVIITCPQHGDFEQLPSNHLQGGGCRDCAISSKTSDSEAFKDSARSVHGDKYDYSKVGYKRSKTNVIITCPLHGDFEQLPNSHLNGHGCTNCGTTSIINSNTSDSEAFKNGARSVHGDKYDYSKVIYVLSKTKVIITCPLHGDFEQTPNNHLKGQECPICGAIRAKKSNTSDSEAFKNSARSVHGDKYDYSKVIYVLRKTKVIITCPLHGDFEQTPNNHLNGSGCFKCSSCHSKAQIQWLDFIASFHSIHIQHAANDGEFTIPETRYRADGYCAETNTVYEYHGDYWHGNPKKFNKDDMNQSSKKTFGELYDQTLKRENEIRALGYNLVVMWESDWLRINRCVRKLQQKFKNDK